MYYQVAAVGPDGAVVRRTVEADSQGEAGQQSGFQAGRILRVRPAILAGQMERIRNPKPRPADQAIFLSSLAALVYAGQPFREGIADLVDQVPALRRNKDVLQTATTASEVLRALNFHPQAIVLAEVGEQSGDVGKALRTAADYVITDEKLRAESRKTVLPGLILTTMAAFYIIAGPILFGMFAETMKTELGDRVQWNIVSHVIIGLRSLYLDHTIWLVATAAVVFWYRNRIWRVIRSWPGLRGLWELIKLQRGIAFITAYIPLYTSGISTGPAIAIVRRNAHRRDKEPLAEIQKKIQGGMALSRALETVDWPAVLRRGLMELEKKSDEMRLIVLDNTLSIMRIQQEQYTRRAGAFLLGGAIGAATFVLIAGYIGVFLPVWTIKTWV